MISQVSEETKKESGKGRIAIYLPSSLTESFEIVLGRVADLIEQGDNPELIHCAGKVSGCVRGKVTFCNVVAIGEVNIFNFLFHQWTIITMLSICREVQCICMLQISMGVMELSELRCH